MRDKWLIGCHTALISFFALLGAAGCGLLPSDPADPPVFGARAEGKVIVVKIPLCSTDDMRRVDVSDFDDTEHETPRTVWWASDPTPAVAATGVVRLWSGEGFRRHAAEPGTSAVPRHLDVGYTDPTGDGRDDVLDLVTIAKAQLKAGEYWTRNGPKTAAQIDAQLHCRGQEAGTRSLPFVTDESTALQIQQLP
ncbi:hypothetical protein ACFVXE_31740 [Streptomyces sp. NPDC058231]|uniref:hypothetical protein n=1 Tax=Streptomyces sp. NPDC058231 TaxID=3346392 RepID=UPI0036E655D9